MRSYLLKQSVNDLPQDYKFNGIDLLKFLCAFLVCFVHIRPINFEILCIENLNDYINFGLQQYLGRIAVPFYFTSSGFLLYKKMSLDNINQDRVKKYCFKILRLLGTWSFLLFVGGQSQLWYLGALVLAVIILSTLIKNNIPMKHIFIISIALYAVGLLGDSYYGFIEPLKKYNFLRIFIVGYETIFNTTRNGAFFGFIFVFMGALFAQMTLAFNSKIALTGLILSMFVMLCEVYLLTLYSHPKDYNMLVSLLPVTFFLFYIASHINLKNNPIYEKLRIIGMIIFFTHLFINHFVKLAIDIEKDKMGIDVSAFQFLITVSFATLLGIIIEKLMKKESFSWLKYILS